MPFIGATGVGFSLASGLITMLGSFSSEAFLQLIDSEKIIRIINKMNILNCT